jgi:hypothetical protein
MCRAIALLGLLIAFAAAENGPAVERSLVVSGQGYFPVALRMHDGRIAVVLRGGDAHVGIKGRLDIVFSSDEGRTWTKPVVVNDSAVDDRNPAFGEAKDGTLVVGFWRTARYDDMGRYNENLDKPVNTWVTRSSDGGKTWSEPQEIDVADIGWGSPYGKIVTLPDGAMLMPVYGEGIRPRGEKPAVHDEASYLFRSTDHGKTWIRFSTPGPKRFNETGLLRLSGGRLVAAMRSIGPQDVWLTASDDEGKTWSEPRTLTPGSVHPPDLLELPDGRVLLVTGYRVAPDFGVRAVVGDKEGRFDWAANFRLVADATSTDCGYPSSVLLKDGRVLTVYYAVGVKGEPEWGVHCGELIYRVPAGR